MRMLRVLKAETHEYTEAIEEVQRRRALRMIGDHGSHFIYRHGQAAWGRPDGAQRRPRSTARAPVRSTLRLLTMAVNEVRPMVADHSQGSPSLNLLDGLSILMGFRL
jgi:hypothetical protein